MPIDYTLWLLLPLKATLIVLNYTYLRFQVRNLNVNWRSNLVRSEIG